MMRSTAFRSALVILLFAIALAAPFVRADESTESFSIYTDKEEYLVGEVINIYVKANAIDTNQNITVTDVMLYDPSNNSIAEWHGMSLVLTDTETPTYVGTVIAESEGSYTLAAEATGCPWILRAIWRFICRFFRPKVVPEVPLGTILSMVAFLGATGVFTLKKRKRI